ncbi:glycosyltransferase family 4 protein [Methylomonas methanica]|uniref:Glycosyltransferase involved in cell wall biosynthesis n=1 Tax=Methylomonas methanica TaxID=421 RepID=A0A177MI37_METMH|nr:glycosyltransferase family 4 protein [Methylomonas methanica]OAI04489.1 hypothetical protein A1332_01960 [Methylomonas methanica]
MSDNPKVLFVQHSGANGGAPMSLFYLLEYVRQHYSVIVYFTEYGPAVDFYEKNGIKCVVDHVLGKLPHCTIENQELNPFCFKFYHDLKPYFKHYVKLIPTYYRMRSILSEEKPDIVHLNSSVLIAEGLATKSLGIPLVWHMRDFLEYGNFKIRYRFLRKIISRCSDVVIGLCESEINRISPEKKALVIPNFISFNKFDYENVLPVNLRSTLGVSSETKVIAILGWNTPAKGALTLMKAFAEISKKFPNSVLVYFGEGQQQVNKSKIKSLLRLLVGKKNLRLELQKIIDAYGLQNRVFFPGIIFDIAGYIAEVDIIAAPFTEPHFARPILEAGAMKTVVITSDIDGTREMVLNGQAGYLAKPGDVEEWSRQLDLALSSDNKDKIEAMYVNTQRTYNSEVNAKNTIAVYRSILANSVNL